MSPAETQVERLDLVRVLVQQKAEIGGRPVGGRDREEHGKPERECRRTNTVVYALRRERTSVEERDVSHRVPRLTS